MLNFFSMVSTKAYLTLAVRHIIYSLSENSCLYFVFLFISFFKLENCDFFLFLNVHDFPICILVGLLCIILTLLENVMPLLATFFILIHILEASNLIYNYYA
jgi:hypothetical protein